jgi:hypothetical protein
VKRSRRAPISALLIGILLAGGLTVVSLSQPGGGCSQGEIVSIHAGSLTPLMLLNSPYNGSSNGTIPVENGSRDLTIFANNSGGVWGYFERMDWTVRIGQPSDGSVASCDQTFYPSPRDDWTSDLLPLFNSSLPSYLNDSQEPSSVQISGSGGPTYFYNQFYQATSKLSTCGTNASVQSVKSNHILVGVEFQYSGVSHVVNVTLDLSTSYRYVFPANGGIWEIDNLSAPGGPGGGWAFSYSPCP